MKYAAGQYATALTEALADVPAAKRPATIRRFLALLRKNRDMRRLATILRKVEKQSLADQGLRKVALVSAEPMPTRVKKEIAAALDLPPHLPVENKQGGDESSSRRWGGKKPLWEETVDPAMLGGIRILIDDELLIDASARRRLDRMFSA